MNRKYFSKNKTRACYGKVRFESRKRAIDFAAKRTSWSKERHEPYFCIFCKGWHLTSKGFSHHPCRPETCAYRKKKICEITHTKCDRAIAQYQCVALQKQAA